MPGPKVGERRYRNPLKIEWNGRIQAVRKLQELERRFGQAYVQELRREAEDTFRETQRQVPVDTGRLRASGRITPVRKDSNGRTRIGIEYGGPGVSYAFWVHEINKNYRRPGSKWHYIIDPMLEAARGMERRLRERLKPILEGRGGPLS